MPQTPSAVVIDWEGLAELFGSLRSAGFRLIGPAVRDGAIVLEELSSPDELPVGWTDEQGPGTYRLERRQDRAAFGHSAGPQSWRRFLAPPRELLWRATRTEDGFEVEDPAVGEAARPLAFIGVRACDLRAIAIQDRVFTGGAVEDPRYGERREHAFIIAVNCTEPGGTCFCTSMGTGPRADSGFDLALTEVAGEDHRFVVEIGTDAGASMMASVAQRSCEPGEAEEAAARVDAASARMGRRMETAGLRELLSTTLDHPHWDDVADRCLSCANCTLVCPTCFCSTVEDTTDLTGDHAERWRHWDSCFTADFSFIHGGSVRPSTRSRYRQWLTHKLGTWHDQFGSSGCVGCGRCIAWCPVGIDLTEEIAALRREPSGPAERGSA